MEEKQKAKMNSKTGEPKFTNFGSGHPRTLDYIFYRSYFTYLFHQIIYVCLCLCSWYFESSLKNYRINVKKLTFAACCKFYLNLMFNLQVLDLLVWWHQSWYISFFSFTYFHSFCDCVLTSNTILVKMSQSILLGCFDDI